MKLFNRPNRSSNKMNGDRTLAVMSSNIESPERPANTAIIYKSELDYISRCILDYPNIETGGQMFGFWTAMGVPVVMYVIGPGRDALHYPTSFIQDQRYLQTVGNELHRRYRLQHIGEWHSHHGLGLTHPSGGDVNTMQYGVGRPGFPRLLLCIGNCTPTHTTVNPFNFHENTPREYSEAVWDVVEMMSPFRPVVDAELRGMLVHPLTLMPSHARINSVQNSAVETESRRSHWLTESAENVDTMKMFVSMVQSMLPQQTVKAEILESGEPLISMKEAGLSIKLPFGFPSKGPELTTLNGLPLQPRSRWELGEEPLITTFGRWLKETLDTSNNR